MKLISISAKGLPLFKDELFIPFYALQRVDEIDKTQLHLLRSESSFYLNNVVSLIGINASGKTSVLKVVILALNIINNEPINHIETRDILGQASEVVLTVCFYSNKDEFGKLETTISASRDIKGDIRYVITEESLYLKPTSLVTTKKQLVDFAKVNPTMVRKKDETFLPDDVSIIIAYSKQNEEYTHISNLLSLTDINILPASGNIPLNIVKFLDPTIEHLFVNADNQKSSVHLKFTGQKEIILNEPAELNHYLSSGTIKGIVAFTMAIEVFKSGGYLVIDELENHFNKEIVATLIRFFMDIRINPNGGTLIFTTHYPELLDEFERNDCINIIRNRNGILVSNLADILKRNDLKKSDAYQSGFLEGTVPVYQAYLDLKKSILSSLKGDN